MSHLLVYLFLGGSTDDIKEMQIKPTVGYFDQISFPIAENYFARCCVSLAGPVADLMIGINYAGCDISKTKEYLKQAANEAGISEVDKEKWIDNEYSNAWDFTHTILSDQKDMIDQLKIRGVEMLNASNLISKNKLKKLAQDVIKQWDETGVAYCMSPSLIVRNHSFTVHEVG